MSTRNSHQSLYRGPARAVPTRTWRRKLTDALSVSCEAIAFVVGLVVVYYDVFIWRP